MNAKRQLVYAFVELPYVTKQNLMIAMGETALAVKEMPDQQKFIDFFKIVGDGDKLEELWDKVAKERERLLEKPLGENPFKDEKKKKEVFTNYDETRISNPQVVIDGLLTQSKAQAKDIREKTERIKFLEEEISGLKKKLEKKGT